MNNFHKIHKVVVPSARAARLWEEAVRVSNENHTFSDVIVCVGANYTQSLTPVIAIKETQELLIAISELFPNARIAWSLTLPQFDRPRLPVFGAVLTGIRYANDVMADFCVGNGFSIIFTPEFSLFEHDFASVRNLFAHDGVHLNKSGIEAMSAAIREYIFDIYMY